jgi:hypothetical protein
LKKTINTEKKLFSDAMLERVDELFVIPPIRITGRIQCIFEIVKQEEQEEQEEEAEKMECK